MSVTWSGYLKVSTTGSYEIHFDLGEPMETCNVYVNGTQVESNSQGYGRPNPPAVYQTYVAGTTYKVEAVCSATIPYMQTKLPAWNPSAELISSTGTVSQLAPLCSPAVVPGSVQNYTASLDSSNSASLSWTTADTPYALNIYRYPYGNTTGIYNSSFATVAPSISAYFDSTGTEGSDFNYDIKEVYSNPVTGGTTLGPAQSGEVIWPYDIGLNPANTGNGRVTLFWSGPPTCASFKIYCDSQAGVPTNLIGSGTTAQLADTRYGQTNSYIFTDTGLTPGTDYYFTVQAFDSAGALIHTSEQVDWQPGTAGIPWDSPNVATIGSAIQSALSAQFGTNVPLYDFVGPNMIAYSYNNGFITSQKFEDGTSFIDSGAPPLTGDQLFTPLSDQPDTSSPTVHPTYVPITGSGGGPYDKFTSPLGYSNILATVTIPARNGNNYYRGVSGTDVFDLYEGGEIGKFSIDAGISWDINDPKSKVDNNFWTPIVNIAPHKKYNFYDNGVLDSPANQDLGQYNGSIRLAFPSNSNGFTIVMGFNEASSLQGLSTQGFLESWISIAGSGTSFIKPDGTPVQGSFSVLGCYNNTFLVSKGNQMRVKAVASIAQGNTGKRSFNNDLSYFEGWDIGDPNLTFTPISIGTPADNGTQFIGWNDHGYWTCSPTYGSNQVIEPVLSLRSTPFENLFEFINTGNGPH